MFLKKILIGCLLLLCFWACEDGVSSNEAVKENKESAKSSSSSTVEKNNSSSSQAKSSSSSEVKKNVDQAVKPAKVVVDESGEVVNSSGDFPSIQPAIGRVTVNLGNIKNSDIPKAGLYRDGGPNVYPLDECNEYTKFDPEFTEEEMKAIKADEKILSEEQMNAKYMPIVIFICKKAAQAKQQAQIDERKSWEEAGKQIAKQIAHEEFAKSLGNFASNYNGIPDEQWKSLTEMVDYKGKQVPKLMDQMIKGEWVFDHSENTVEIVRFKKDKQYTWSATTLENVDKSKLSKEQLADGHTRFTIKSSHFIGSDDDRQVTYELRNQTNTSTDIYTKTGWNEYLKEYTIQIDDKLNQYILIRYDLKTNVEAQRYQLHNYLGDNK